MSNRRSQIVKVVEAPEAQKEPRSPLWGWVVLLLPFVILGGLALWALQGESAAPPRPTSEDRVLQSFMRQVNQGDAGAKELLGPAAVFDEQPVSEAEADARQADYFLRHPKLRIESIRPGEHVKGKRVPTPNRYTLVTKVQASTPPLRVRDAAGRVEPPSQLSMKDPDIVVDVKDGKLHAVRADLSSD
jgi:hypothetical protein